MTRQSTFLSLAALAALFACSRPEPARVASDALCGVHVGMKRKALNRAFTPKGEGKWFELESVAGEGRVRWVGATDATTPISVDVALEQGIVRELVFALREGDARAAVAAMGAGSVSGLTELAGPSGRVIVAPGLGTWTVTLRAK